MAKTTNVTLSVPVELKSKMDSFREINWSEVMRNTLSEKVRRLEIMKRLDELTFVSLLPDVNSSNLFIISSLLTFSDNVLRITSLQFISLNESILDLSSTGTDKVTFVVLAIYNSPRVFNKNNKFIRVYKYYA